MKKVERRFIIIWKNVNGAFLQVKAQHLAEWNGYLMLRINRGKPFICNECDYIGEAPL